jgi:demethylmenaquinone methyltransferase/2-methoxy-6-polyprenyl-1,4-benzoquinol methylase
MDTEEPLKAYYAARAPEYDAIYRKPERQDDLRAIEAWLPDALRGRAVLEIACGTGYWTAHLAPAVRRLLALDSARETLAIARDRVRAQHVTFVEGDAYALPAAARECDAAFAGFWYSHIPLSRIAPFLDHLHGTLAPGARVVFLDNRYVAGSSTPVAERDPEGNTYQVRRLADGSVHRVLKNFPDADALRTALQGRARDIRVREWRHYWAVEYVAARDGAGG